MRTDAGGFAEALIAIGSNIAPEKNVPRAIADLYRETLIDAVSNFYWSEPVGDAMQPRFLNGALRVRTDFTPRELKFDLLRAIEESLGRVRTADKFAPRAIDLDIALFQHVVVDEADLRIPDPDIAVRPFLAIPLAEVASDWVVPGIGATLQAIADGMSHDGLTFDPTMTARCRLVAMRRSQT